MKHVLVVGGAGYIGSVLVGELLNKSYKVTVLDRMFFGYDSLEQYKGMPNFWIIKDDIRYFDQRILRGVDTVINLAGLSNDPSCELDPQLTDDINHLGALRLGVFAKSMGVKRYIFSSSCSVYGSAQSNQLTETSPCYPVSAYAKSKLDTESDLLALSDNDFGVVIMRNGTVYGLSPKMRFDLVVNMMTYHASKRGKIYIMGGGDQWRPNVHIKDVCKAFILAMEADSLSVNGQIYNVGDNELNYTVKQIANIVQDVIGNVELEIIPEDADKRNYNVCFDKINEILDFMPEYTVKDGVTEIKEALELGIVNPDDMRTVTVKHYKYLIDAERTLKEVMLKGRLF